MKTPKATKGKYQHYRNKRFYKLIDVVRHSETEEWMVLYKPLYKSSFADLSVRPYKMFFEKAKDPETGKMVPRFALIRPKRKLKK